MKLLRFTLMLLLLGGNAALFAGPRSSGTPSSQDAVFSAEEMPLPEKPTGPAYLSFQPERKGAMLMIFPLAALIFLFPVAAASLLPALRPKPAAEPLSAQP